MIEKVNLNLTKGLIYYVCQFTSITNVNYQYNGFDCNTESDVLPLASMKTRIVNKQPMRGS